VPCVGVREQDGVRQVLRSIGRRLKTGIISSPTPFTTNVGWRMALSSGESLALERFPLTETPLSVRSPRSVRRQRRGRPLRCDSLRMNASAAAWLACDDVKKILLQDIVPTVRRVLDSLRQARFLEVHDVLAASRPVPTRIIRRKIRRPVLHHLKRNHPTEGVPEDVTRLDSDRLEKCPCMLRHSGDGCWEVARSECPTPALYEQDDLTVQRRAGRSPMDPSCRASR